MSELLVPDPDEITGFFWEGCAAGELRVQQCGSCERLVFPPRPMCPWCRSVDRTHAVMSGRGAIWSYIVPHPPLLAAYAEMAPYNVCAVALEEDPVIRLIGNLVASPDGPIDEVDPETIEIGTPVVAVFQPLAEGITVPRWMVA